MDLRLFKEALENNQIHSAKEAKLIGLGKIKKIRDTINRPILVLPLCCEDSTDFLANIINIIINRFKNYSSSILIYLATDGDTNRQT